MSATAISDCIPCTSPAGASLQIVRDDREGSIVVILRVGGVPASVRLDATGWRGLSHALGVAPAADFVPVGRHCRVCCKCEPEITTWVAANLCSNCLHRPIATRGARGGNK